MVLCNQPVSLCADLSNLRFVPLYLSLQSLVLLQQLDLLCKV